MKKIWQIEFKNSALKDLRKLGKPAQLKINKYLFERISVAEDPTVFGKPLRGDFSGLWRYRVDDYRIVCQIKDNKMEILVVKIGHRKDIYE